MGGDPTNALDTGHAPFYHLMEEGGSNWFYYIHPQLSDPNSGINYHLELTDDLTPPAWTNAGYEITGTTLDGFAPGLDAVTNRVLTEVNGQQFLRLTIEEL